jgi:nitrate reductase gamma subunit
MDMDIWLEWARGPVFRGALAFMILGLIRHVAITIFEIHRAFRRAGDKTIPWSALAKATLRWLFPLSKAKNRLGYSLTTVSFHISILIVPLFLGGHILLWEGGIGFGWPAIPNLLASILTIVAIATAAALVIERAAARSTRSLSRFQDYALPLLIAIPFVSGFLVMHPAINPVSFQAMMFVHVMSANLLLILIPLTKLSHCVLLPTTQVISEVAWHFPADSGSDVARALGKESEPV